MTARLADGARAATALPASVRAQRAAAVKLWLTSLALPAASRVPFARAAEASASGDAVGIAAALRLVLTAVETQLDVPAAAELRELAAALDAPNGGNTST